MGVIIVRDARCVKRGFKGRLGLALPSHKKLAIDRSRRGV
jgi:hypothetical protein